MFFTGDLQAGIALALQESKSVACFITDEQERSEEWEGNFLAEARVSSALAQRAVTLRILAESQAATFLKAYYPVHTVPCLIIIRNGQLILDLRSHVEKEDFVTQILKTLDSASEVKLQSATDSPAAVTSNPSTASQNVSTDSLSHNQTASAPPSSEPSTQALPSSSGSAPPNLTTAQAEPTSSQHPAVERLLVERRQRLEKQRKEQEVADRVARKAQAEARQAALTTDPKSTRGQQASYASEQKKRKLEAAAEKQRILDQIEQDKLDRREREERRKFAARGEISSETANVKEGSVTDTAATSSGSQSQQCAIQVRLFDGSSFRGRFASDGTIISHIRPWIDSSRPKIKDSYTFKQILSPTSNRKLGEEDEHKSLTSLNLTPSSTLILVPIRGAASAYSDAPGPVMRGFTSLYEAIAGLLLTLWGFLATFLGLGQNQAGQGPRNGTDRESIAGSSAMQEQQAAAVGPKMRIRTLQDQRADQRKKDGEKQFYNGNQLNFEPRKDEDDEDTKAGD